MGDAVLDAFLRYLVELDALGGLLAREKLVGQMPGDRFTLAVGVGREQDLVGRLRGLLELLDDLLLAGNDLVRLLEPSLDVDAELLGQVLDVALGGEHLVLRPQVLLDRLGLRGRLDDDERLSHSIDYLAIFVI